MLVNFLVGTQIKNRLIQNAFADKVKRYEQTHPQAITIVKGARFQIDNAVTRIAPAAANRCAGSSVAQNRPAAAATHSPVAAQNAHWRGWFPPPNFAWCGTHPAWVCAAAANIVHENLVHFFNQP